MTYKVTLAYKDENEMVQGSRDYTIEKLDEGMVARFVVAFFDGQSVSKCYDNMHHILSQFLEMNGVDMPHAIDMLAVLDTSIVDVPMLDDIVVANDLEIINLETDQSIHISPSEEDVVRCVVDYFMM